MAATAHTARERLGAVVSTDRQMRVIEARAADVIAAKDHQLQIQARAHDAVQRTKQRRLASDWGSGNNIVGMDAYQLRVSARDRDRNHDISRNALNILVQNTIGTGIDVMPAPRRRGGKVDRVLAQDLRDLWDEWWDRPEVTWQHDFGKCQQLLARSEFRDGDAFFQSLIGPVAFLDHGTSVPYSIEMIEADLVPLDFNDPGRNIRQGVECNAWGRPIAWHVYKSHPGDFDSFNLQTKRVPAEQMRHVAMIDRIHQRRGLSIFAAVLNRLVDVGDYEDSERIAAKVAASLCAQIVKGNPETYRGPEEQAAMGAALDRVYRSLTMVPGLIADDLEPGESIEMIDSKRPNPNIATYIGDQLRRAAGGFGVSASSLTRNYDGTYSAQRQELVEQFGAYAMLGERFVAAVLRPVWRDFCMAAKLAGLIALPRGWSDRDLTAAAYIRPQMPWIDPLKEALARGEMEDRGWQAPQQSMLQIGNDPEEVRRLREDWVAQQPDVVPANPTPQTEDTAARRTALLAHALKEND